MEQPEQFNNNINGTEPSYWMSIGIAAFVIGLISFVIQLIFGYVQISSEPSGSPLSPMTFSGIFACLAGAFGGMMAVWHYAREYDITMKLGKGALIGFLTGVAMVFVGIVFSELWEFIDPDYNQKVMESMMANFEAMDMPEANRQQMMDSMGEQLEGGESISTQLLWGIPVMGILNLLTGMLGVSLFAREKEEEF